MKHILNKTIAPLLTALGFATFAGAASGENFTTAAEVRPILDVTKANWIAVRQYAGSDLLYFSNLLAWRCGLEKIEYALNSDAPVLLDAEPCHVDEAQPNALKVETQMPFVKLPLASLKSVDVIITYDDGATQTVSYQRKDIEIN